MAESDRDIAFANESFLIGVLQAVSGGSIVAGLSQYEPLTKLSGKTPFLIFVSVLALSLLAAVAAAYWKHAYKVADIKAQLAARRGEVEFAERRSSSAASGLRQMRWAMGVGVWGIVIAYGVLISSMWFQHL